MHGVAVDSSAVTALQSISKFDHLLTAEFQGIAELDTNSSSALCMSERLEGSVDTD